MIDPSIVVIAHITLGDDVSIWPLVAIRGDVNHVHVGARTNIQDGCVLHVTHCSERNPPEHPLIIGDEVTGGIRPCYEVVIGAGSLVESRKHLNSGYLYFDSPARRVRHLTPAEIDNLIYSANNYYVQWKNDYLNQTDKQQPPVEGRLIYYYRAIWHFYRHSFWDT